MFTGIIEAQGLVERLEKESDNLHISVKSHLSTELKIDQSVSHNGVCLTVVDIKDDVYTVTAIQETLLKTNIGNLQVGDAINLERAMLANARLDGHIVQGHVDQTAQCTQIKESGGSWYFNFAFEPTDQSILVKKGSICVNGVSLTVVDCNESNFSVAIIPYTYEHTNFNAFKIGTTVNLEFDVIGKYVKQLAKGYSSLLEKTA